MGNWVTISKAGASGYTPPPDAPNITSVAASAYYGMWFNASAYGLQGTITLPTLDVNYGHLKEIDISVLLPDGSTQPVGGALYSSSFAGTTITFKSPCELLLTSASQSVMLTFSCKNDAGIKAAGSVTSTVTIAASAVTGFTSASDSGTRSADLNRSVSTIINWVPILGGGIVPQNVTSWLPSPKDPTKYQGIGWTKMTTVGQTFSTARLVPSAASTWYVYCAAGYFIGDPSHDYTVAELVALGAVASAGFAVAGMALPLATAITTASVGAAVAITDPDGHQYVRIPGVTWTDPTDVNAAFTRITVQCVDSAGNPAPGKAAGAGDQGGDEVVFAGPNDPLGDVVSAGKVRATDPLEFDYNPAGSVYTYMQYRQYSQNRNATSTADWSDSTKSVLQTTAWTGAAYKRVNFGSLPPGAMVAARFAVGAFPDGVTFTLPGNFTMGSASADWVTILAS
jgi:hypothetical protein